MYTAEERYIWEYVEWFLWVTSQTS
jgi:hypothetical protein